MDNTVTTLERRASGPFISVRKAAALMGISHSTLYRAIDAGCAPVKPERLGKRLAFRRAEVERFVAGTAPAA
jgi:excisionase family DNA binding protein